MLLFSFLFISFYFKVIIDQGKTLIILHSFFFQITRIYVIKGPRENMNVRFQSQKQISILELFLKDYVTLSITGINYILKHIQIEKLF